LAKLLVKDGWQAGRKGRHGRVYTKTVAGKTLVTIVSLKTVPIPAGTLAAILGPQQTALGKQGLRALIDKYGSR
jgi:predicted RNA binding protein YcfA (HicA-like mRNA interferase family)